MMRQKCTQGFAYLTFHACPLVNPTLTFPHSLATESAYDGVYFHRQGLNVSCVRCESPVCLR